MILTIASSGGFAGLGAGPEREIDVDSLPEPVQAQVCEVFGPERLQTYVAPLPDGAADMVVYHLKAVDGARSVEADLREDQMSPDMLDLMDGLIHGFE